MNRLIILFTVLLISASSFAQDNGNGNKLIRHDRVWLCQSYLLGEYTDKYMQFKDSAEINGKIYTRVSTIKKVIENSFAKPPVYEIHDNIDETQAWMREENGKVYLLLDGWEPYEGAPEPSDLVEGILYDFYAEKDSTYVGISQYRYSEDWVGLYFEGINYVSSVGTVTVGDEEVKCQNIRFRPIWEQEWDTPIHDYLMIEGIGIVDYGGLFYLETCLHTSGHYRYNEFLCCLDTDGNILYPQDYKRELPGGGLPSASVIGMPVNENETDNTIYDIMGRRISEPIPGQMYIQGGKKKIASAF